MKRGKDPEGHFHGTQKTNGKLFRSITLDLETFQNEEIKRMLPCP